MNEKVIKYDYGKDIRFEPLDEPYDRYAICNQGYFINVDTGKILSASPHEKSGRMKSNLAYTNDEGDKVAVTVFVAKKVADYFLPNPYNLNYIGFKDGDPSNSHVDNLYWCERAIWSTESRNRYAREDTEEERHSLICQINKAIDKGDWETAERLGSILWTKWASTAELEDDVEKGWKPYDER